MLYRGDNPIQDRSTKNRPSLVSVQVLANHRPLRAAFIRYSTRRLGAQHRGMLPLSDQLRRSGFNATDEIGSSGLLRWGGAT